MALETSCGGERRLRAERRSRRRARHETRLAAGA